MIWLAVALAIVAGVAAALAVAIVRLRRYGRDARGSRGRGSGEARGGRRGSHRAHRPRRQPAPLDAPRNPDAHQRRRRHGGSAARPRAQLQAARVPRHAPRERRGAVADGQRGPGSLPAGNRAAGPRPAAVRSARAKSTCRSIAWPRWRPSAGSISRTTSTGPAPSTLLGDAARLRHVLATLLTYAVRRTHEGGVALSVSTRPSPPDRHEVSFVVRDTGMVIAPERAARLFQPLSRIIASDRVADAQDLGLTLCHGIASLMGGAHRAPERAARRLDVRVRHAGGEPGANPPDAGDRRRRSNRSSRRHPPPLRILLAEDSVVAQKVAVGRAGAAGAHGPPGRRRTKPCCARSTPQRYDVILMDMHMPEMDGLTATRRVCERWPRERRPRIIALSASDLPEDRARWLGAGADGWISKSLPIDEVRHVLSSLAAPTHAPARRQRRRPAGVAVRQRSGRGGPHHRDLPAGRRRAAVGAPRGRRAPRRRRRRARGPHDERQRRHARRVIRRAQLRRTDPQCATGIVRRGRR